MATNRSSVVKEVRYAPGVSYRFYLRCSLCDFSLTYERKGPGKDPEVNCPNCLRQKGLAMKMFPSLR